ncbi:uncharacterized protein LOC126960686 [Macaca thibetana thibetana]|uniref:uncharacterized protein LOC126960686 n=1 Tax=Macaca thibetana thibetana TaxID=257877 RepID=UPI0021BCCB86|nr:uncharacterized protein LOC126960686 [Macaca thibetana thibetana]
MRRGGRASRRPRAPTFSVWSADSFYPAPMLQGPGRAASAGRLARFCRTRGRKTAEAAADGDSSALLKSRRPAAPSWRLTGRRQGRSHPGERAGPNRNLQRPPKAAGTGADSAALGTELLRPHKPASAAEVAG